MLASIFLFAAASIASPITARTDDKQVWTVPDFQGGCSPAACTYNFNISAPAGGTAPAFKTSCSGTTVQDGYADCAFIDENQRLAARMVAVPLDANGGSTLEVSHEYINKQPTFTTRFNDTGNGTAYYTDHRPNHDSVPFTITPTVFTAVV